MMQRVFAARLDNRDWYPGQYKSFFLNKYLALEIAKFRCIGTIVYQAGIAAPG
jgi:hypothetical protein